MPKKYRYNDLTSQATHVTKPGLPQSLTNGLNLMFETYVPNLPTLDLGQWFIHHGINLSIRKKLLQLSFFLCLVSRCIFSLSFEIQLWNWSLFSSFKLCFNHHCSIAFIPPDLTCSWLRSKVFYRMEGFFDYLKLKIHQTSQKRYIL